MLGCRQIFKSQRVPWTSKGWKTLDQRIREFDYLFRGTQKEKGREPLPQNMFRFCYLNRIETGSFIFWWKKAISWKSFFILFIYGRSLESKTSQKSFFWDGKQKAFEKVVIKYDIVSRFNLIDWDFLTFQFQIFQTDGVLGSISPTYLRSAFTPVAPKSVRIQSSCQFLFTLLGSTGAKAARRMFMKLTLGQWNCKTAFYQLSLFCSFRQIPFRW